MDGDRASGTRQDSPLVEPTWPVPALPDPLFVDRPDPLSRFRQPARVSNLGDLKDASDGD